MHGDRILLLGIGVMGMAASVLLYAAPTLTFARVIRIKSAEGFSFVPYTLALLNSLLYTWYSFPVVSVGWENALLIAINGFGLLFELSFLSIYFRFSSPPRRKMVGLATIAVLVVFGITVAISTLSVHDHRIRKLLVGGIGVVASVAMYASPLVVVKTVIRTKSVEFMPFYLSFFSFLASFLWLSYGLLGQDLIIAAPNLIGAPLGIIQLVIYCKYRKSKGMEEPENGDVEEIHDEPTEQQQEQV